MTLDPQALRADFPLLARELAGQPLVHLDCASTAPRPRVTLAAIREHHETSTANVHRGVHALAAEASAAFESARHMVARHLGASPAEIAFTSGTTDSINVVAASLGLARDDEVVVTAAEHHSNLLPWRRVARTVVLPSRADGVPRFELLERALTPRTRLIAVHHVSNVLGTIAPIAEIARIAAARRIPLLVDGAQAAGHLPVDVGRLGCDFYAFSGHKAGGPSGIGALYARADQHERLEPVRLGGGMVARVGAADAELRAWPHRFEPGTPNVEGALGLAAALEYLQHLGLDRIAARGRAVAGRLLEIARRVPGARVLGDGEPRVERIPLVALALPDSGLDAESLARTLSDSFGILVGAGRHCAHPLHDALGAGATLRASAWMFTTDADLDRFAAALGALTA